MVALTTTSFGSRLAPPPSSALGKLYSDDGRAELAGLLATLPASVSADARAAAARYYADVVTDRHDASVPASSVPARMAQFPAAVASEYERAVAHVGMRMEVLTVACVLRVYRSSTSLCTATPSAHATWRLYAPSDRSVSSLHWSKW